MTTLPAPKAVSEGTLKELVKLFMPILFIAFSSAFFIFLQNIFFARISPEAIEAAINVTYVCRIFQISSILLVMMAQVHVGRAYGAHNWKAIGPIIWQFIWFAILSMFITVPASLIYGHFYFEGTSIEIMAKPYLYSLISMNFIFPLGATLSCFFIGRGYTRWVLLCKLGSELFTLILAYFLILGNGWIPELGLKGSAISLFVGNAGFCILLLSIFLNKKNGEMFDSRAWCFKPRLFWDSIKSGLLRGLGGMLNFTSWSAIAHLMAAQGGDFLLALSIGGSLFLFLSCFGEALCQSMTTVFSQMLGAKKYGRVGKSIRSGLMLSLLLILLTSVPCIFFPRQFCHLFFPTVVFAGMYKVFLGLWLSISFYILIFIPISLVLALKDTKFVLFMGGMAWVYGYAIMYIAINKVGIAADEFWIVLGFTHLLGLLFYIWRARRHMVDFRLEPTTSMSTHTTFG